MTPSFAYGCNEQEQNTLALIIELRDGGCSAYQIAKKLDGWGIPPRVSPTWSCKSVSRIFRRLDAHSDGNSREILDVVRDAPRCPWCFKYAELSNGKPNCVKCGHRLDVSKYKCDCESCKIEHT